MHRRSGALCLLLRDRGKGEPTTESESVQERKRMSQEQGEGERGLGKDSFQKMSKRSAVSEAVERKNLERVQGPLDLAVES